MNYLLFSFVWGRSYTDLFLEVTIPTLLSPNNLPYLAEAVEGEKIYRIYTTADDRARIERSPLYPMLSELIDVTFDLIDPDAYAHKYELFHRFFREPIDFARKNDFYVSPITPDPIADGRFKNAVGHARRGTKAILAPWFRASTEYFTKAFQAQFGKGESVVSVTSRDLVRIGLETRHPETLAYYWRSPHFRIHWPSLILWEIENEGVVCLGFHLATIMFKPPEEVPYSPEKEDALLIRNLATGIDAGSYLSRAYPGSEDVYVSTDSDAFFHVDLLSDETHYDDYTAVRKKDYLELALWAHDFAGEIQRYNFRHAALLHHKDVSEKWNAVLDEVSSVTAPFWKTLRYLSDTPGAAGLISDKHNQLSASSEKDAFLRVASHFGARGSTGGDGLPGTAVSIWEKGAELFPDAFEFPYNLFTTYNAAADTAAAERSLARLLSSAPDNPDFAALALSFYIKQKRLEQADDLARRFLASNYDKRIDEMSKALARYLSSK